LWPLLTIEEQRSRDEKFVKENQADIDKKEESRRLKELSYNVKLEEDADVTASLKVHHKPKKVEGEAAGGTEDAEKNAKIFRDLTRVSESSNLSRDKIQSVLDDAAAKTNKTVTTRLTVKKLTDA